MDCEDVQKKYQLFLDDELNGAEIESFEQHVKKCSRCGRIIRFEQHFHMTITKKVQTRSAPQELIKRIRTKLF